MDSQWQRNTQCKGQGTLKGTPWPGLCLQQRKTRLMCTAVSYLSFMLWAPLGPSNSSSLAILCSSSRFWDELRPSRFQGHTIGSGNSPAQATAAAAGSLEVWADISAKLPASSETSARTWLCSCACECVCVYMYTDSNMGPLRIQPPPLRGANWNWDWGSMRCEEFRQSEAEEK